MAVRPVVRYMILCEDWEADTDNPRSINIFGLLSTIRSVDQPPYPFLLRELCVFLALTEARGTGNAQIICVFEETGQRIWRTPKRKIRFGKNPLEVVAVPFRVRDCRFPLAGVYLIQFWYNGQKVEERPLLLR